MKTEIILATLSNFKQIGVVASIILAAITTIILFHCFFELSPPVFLTEDKKIQLKGRARFALMKLLPLTFVVSLVICIPSIEDLWKVRIGLIKLELASPENIEKGADEIARIAKRLECKYLGCEDKK